jgi:hypothetical protein
VTRISPTDKPGHRAVTANRLEDGAVVYAADGGSWTRQIKDAILFADPGAEARLIEQIASLGARAPVVDVAVIELAPEQAGPPRPVRLRERIRLAGPTIQY